MPTPALPARCAIASLVLIAACEAAPPPAPPIMVTGGTDSVHLPFIEVARGTWVGADRYALLSTADDAVVLADMATGTATRLGAGGSELQHPANVFALGDTLYVPDWGRQRVSLWTADGRFVRAIPADPAMGGVLPSAIDAGGRFYYELKPKPGADGSGNRDSAAVARKIPGAGTPDTIARLSPLDLAQVTGDAGKRFERRVFSGEDEWGVTPDGSVWVARVYGNRVEWRSPTGEIVKGEALRDRVLEVTRTDREQFINRFPPELRRTAELLPFAPIKPPFVGGFTAPDGAVWLEKSRHPADTTQLYHVVNRDGKLRWALEVGGWGRIVAAGQGVALIAVPDTTGYRLTRAALPK